MSQIAAYPSQAAHFIVRHPPSSKRLAPPTKMGTNEPQSGAGHAKQQLSKKAAVVGKPCPCGTTAKQVPKGDGRRTTATFPGLCSCRVHEKIKRIAEPKGCPRTQPISAPQRRGGGQPWTLRTSIICRRPAGLTGSRSSKVGLFNMARA
jgi:hypothetical protein